MKNKRRHIIIFFLSCAFLVLPAPLLNLFNHEGLQPSGTREITFMIFVGIMIGVGLIKYLETLDFNPLATGALNGGMPPEVTKIRNVGGWICVVAAIVAVMSVSEDLDIRILHSVVSRFLVLFVAFVGWSVIVIPWASWYWRDG